MLTAIEDRLLTVAAIARVNRRVNPNYVGASCLPAVEIEYGYSANIARGHSRSQQDSLQITLTTAAVDQGVGSADIDAHLAVDGAMYEVLDGWMQGVQITGASPVRWRRVSGGDVTRNTGFCQSVIRYQRQLIVPACE